MRPSQMCACKRAFSTPPPMRSWAAGGGHCSDHVDQLDHADTRWMRLSVYPGCLRRTDVLLFVSQMSPSHICLPSS